MTFRYMQGRCTPGFVCAAAVANMMMLLVACAHPGATAAHRTDCGLTDRDSVFALAGPVYRDCAVDRTARLTSTVRLDHSQLNPSSTTCYSADVEFVVDTAGNVETRSARIVRATDTKFAEIVMASVPSWKYEPASRDGKLVRQIVASHQALSAVLGRVVVPAGGALPSTPPRTTQRAPSC